MFFHPLTVTAPPSATPVNMFGGGPAEALFDPDAALLLPSEDAVGELADDEAVLVAELDEELDDDPEELLLLPDELLPLDDPLDERTTVVIVSVTMSMNAMVGPATMEELARSTTSLRMGWASDVT